MEKKYLNISGYCFFNLENPLKWKELLHNFCFELEIKGTIILATEGINIYVCGLPENIHQCQKYLHEKLNVPDIIDYKESLSEFQPYKRLLVKVKKEIVTMRCENIEPAKYTSPHISPKQFKEWLDQNKDMYVLDVRNNFEIAYGKFKVAKDLQTRSFVAFAKKAKDIPAEIKEKPVVMYCTGGIRCEKASALFVKEYGFKEVYQLEGGILKYLQQCGEEHYEGKCFVFDERVAVTSKDL